MAASAKEMRHGAHRETTGSALHDEPVARGRYR
jgi:hypothetical protein